MNILDRLFGRRRALDKFAFVGVVLAFLLLFLGQGQVAHAAAITVNTTEDELNADGDCSLREALHATNLNTAVDACPAGKAKATDTITVPAGTYTLNIGGTGEDASVTGDLDITGNLKIKGAGENTTIIDGNALDRVFDVLTSAEATISEVTIRNGNLGWLDCGGGIRNRGALTIKNSTVSDNTSMCGGGIFNDEPGTLTLNKVTVSANTAIGDGIFGEGGGIYNIGTLTVRNCIISSNNGKSGGGVSGGVLTINNSTISVNTASWAGGGINGGELTLTNSIVNGNMATYGGGIYMTGALSITGSTISSNTANAAGGIWMHDPGTLTESTVSGNTVDSQGGGIYTEGDLTITNSTISGNSAGDRGGGIMTDGDGTVNLNNATVTNNTAGNWAGGILRYNASTVSLKNTILAGNSAPGAPDCTSAIISAWILSAGHNLLGDDSGCQFSATTGDQVGTGSSPINPLIGPLQNNGSPTQTHALLAGSPAIDAASSDCPPPATDQRGVARPQGTACDIGAYEL